MPKTKPDEKEQPKELQPAPAVQSAEPPTVQPQGEETDAIDQPPSGETEATDQAVGEETDAAQLQVIARVGFEDALTKRSYRAGDVVPWPIERGRRYATHERGELVEIREV